MSETSDQLRLHIQMNRTPRTSAVMTGKLRISRRASWCVVMLLLLLTVHSASAQSVVIPILDAMYHDPMTGSNTAVFGYINTGSSPRTISRGFNNMIQPEPFNRNQPTTFLPGVYHNVFVTDLTTNVSWSVFGISATASWSGVYDAPITYQGRLSNQSQTVNGLTDFRFALYDSVTNGAQIPGSTRLFEAGATADQGGSSITVSNGLFTTVLNFQNAQLVSNVWLEIQVRNPAGQGSYQTLSPRQPLTGTPQAANAQTLGGLAPASFLQLNANSPGTALSVTNGLKTFSGTLFGSFMGDGSRLINLNASQITGTFSQLEFTGGGGTTNYATSGPESLRIVRGIVDNNGNILKGNGFTVTHSSAGTYVINFSVPFLDWPSVTATGANGAHCSWNLLNGNSVTIYTAQSNGTQADAYFNFIAVGP